MSYGNWPYAYVLRRKDGIPRYITPDLLAVPSVGYIGARGGSYYAQRGLRLYPNAVHLSFVVYGLQLGS